jgi:sec-independent protein translocase protein TatB
VFGLGFFEILIILVLALILLGPQRLPDAAKQLGKSLREFKKATEDLKSQFEGELYDTGRTKPRPPAATVPGGGAEGAPAALPPPGPAPAATAENVPGLEAALADPVQAKGPVEPERAPIAAAPGEKEP